MIDRTKIPGGGWRKRWREKLKNLNEWNKEKKNRKTKETNTVKYVCWIEWKHRRKNDANSNNRISDWIIKWKKMRKKKWERIEYYTAIFVVAAATRERVNYYKYCYSVLLHTHIGEIKIKSRSSNMDGFIRWLSCEFHRTRLINSHILFSFPLFPFRRHKRARTNKRTNETRGRATLYRLKFAIQSMQFHSSWNYIFT